MSDPIETKVKQIVAAQLEVDIAKVVPDASFIEVLKVDELQEQELVLAYEEAFEIEISDEDASGFWTVGDVIAYIRKRAR